MGLICPEHCFWLTGVDRYDYVKCCELRRLSFCILYFELENYEERTINSALFAPKLHKETV